jgi:hypothetical protein
MDVYRGDLPDHNQQVAADRAGYVCAGVFTREQVQADPAWEPTQRGWRCGTCSRRRWGLVAQAADLLIAHTVPRWTIVRVSPAHQAFAECLACEALEQARGRLLYWGFTAAETNDPQSATAGAPMARDACAAEHVGVLRAIGAQELQRPGTAWDSGFSPPVGLSARVPSQASPRF